MVSKGSVKAFLVWSGVPLYLIYAYVIYAFDIHFNRLFLVYVAILGLSFVALCPCTSLSFCALRNGGRSV